MFLELSGSNLDDWLQVWAAHGNPFEPPPIEQAVSNDLALAKSIFANLEEPNSFLREYGRDYSTSSEERPSSLRLHSLVFHSARTPNPNRMPVPCSSIILFSRVH